MNDAEHDNYSDVAQTILGEAMDKLMAAGASDLLALHSMVKFTVDTLPGYCCRCCLPDHYDAIVGYAESALAEVDGMVPGKDCAIGCCDKPH